MHRLSLSFFSLNSFPFLGRKRRPKPLTVRWVLPGQLAVGWAINHRDGQVLQTAGIHTIVSLCAETEAVLPPKIQRQFHCIRYPLPDSHSSLMLSHVEVIRVLKIIHASIIQRQPVYVHCLAGMERSPTICLAYLCLYHGYNIDESLVWLKQVHPRTMPTEQQLNVVRFLIDTQTNLQPRLSSSSHFPQTSPSSPS